MSSYHEAWAFEPHVENLAINSNRKSWNENKGQKWICKITKCLQNSPPAVRFGHFWFTRGAFTGSLCASSHFHVALFYATGFGVWILIPCFPFSLFFLSLWLPRSAETRSLCLSCQFATLDPTQWSILAVLWFWLSWAQNSSAASVQQSDPKDSEDEYSRNEKTSDPTLFLCWLMIKMWNWVRHGVFLLVVSWSK